MISYLRVKGQSMEPLCKEGDFVLVDTLSYLVFRPKTGDIVVLRHPKEERLILKYIVKEKVAEHHSFYWIEGLNKEGSSDSRIFGWIPRGLVLGKALIIRRQPQKKFSTGYGLQPWTNDMIKAEGKGRISIQ